MPSGSHGGSRGSHSSGGARSSGSSGGGGGRGSVSNRGSRPFRMRFGTRVYVFGGKTGIFIPLIFISLFILMFCCIVNSGVKHNISNIETDFIYYKAMVQKAEINPSLKKQGTITDYFYNEDCKKWYYIYEIEIENSVKPLEGYTYSLYTFEQISKLNVGDVIEIAVNNPNVNLYTDSVPMDFKDFELEDDGEYIEAKKTKKIMTTMIVIFSILSAALVVGAIVYMVKTKKREDLEQQEEKTRVEEKHELEKKALEKDLDWRCEYCGSLNKSGKSKCSTCGAGRKK